MTSLRTAVIGVGALGRHHARILSGLPNVQLVGVVDSNQQQGESVAQGCGTKWFDSCEPLFDQVDAVSVVVPTVAHLAVASQFLERGIGVLVEKPIASSVAEARQLVSLAKAHRAVLQVGHIERFNPAMKTASASITNPKYIRAERVSPYTFRSTDIGVVLDLMIHDLDLILAMVKSPIDSVEAFGVAIFGGTEDSAQARIRFRNGCIADLTASRVCPEPIRKMQVWSESGCSTIDFGARTVSKFTPGSALLAGEHIDNPPTTIEARAEMMKTVFGRFIDVVAFPVEDGDALTAELSEFVECVRTGSEPTVAGKDGLAAIEAAKLVLESISAHCWDGSPAGRVGPRVTPAKLRVA